MKSILLATVFVTIFSSLSFSQFQLDYSTGVTHMPNGVIEFSRNGLSFSATPSIALKGKFRFRTTVQYRKQITVFANDSGNLDFSPELEYEWFDFLSFGVGIHASRNLNSQRSAAFSFSPEIGPVFFVEFFKFRNAYATIRYIKPLIDEVKDLLDVDANNNPFIQDPRIPGFFQFGIGYTFGKK